MVKAGYKQTEIGEMPADWDVKRLEEIASFTNGKAHEGSVVEDGKFVLVNSKFISTEGKVIKRTNAAHCLARTGQVLMVMSDVPNGKAVAKCYLVRRDEKYTVNQRICALGAHGDPKFLFYILDRNKYFLAFDDGAKQTNLRKEEVLNCLVPKPHVSEQQLIGSALSDVDELIGSLEKLIAKKRDIKTATMQQLLTGKKRLPGFGEGKETKQTELGEIPEDWDEIALDEIGYSIIGLTYRPQDTADNGTLVLRSSNVQNNQLAFRDNVYVSNEVPARVIVQSGDLLVCVRNGSRALIGKCALIDKETSGSAFGAFMTVFRSQESAFVFYQFQSRCIKKQIEEIMGATINQITNKDMAAFKIPFPRDLKERQAICTVLNDITTEIASIEKRLTKTKAIKQGMMQELLTGRTRLV